MTQPQLLFFLYIKPIGQEIEIMCYVTRRSDIPGYSMDLSTNKRVYRKLYSKKYKNSRKFCFKMLRVSSPGAAWKCCYKLKICS